MENETLQDESVELQRVVLTQVMRMNATINGIVLGLLIGGGIFVATLWLVLKGGEVVGPHLSLLDQFFFGYSVTFGGALVGFVWGFLVGFTIGYFIAFTYNKMVDIREGWHARGAKHADPSAVPEQDDGAFAASALSGALDASGPNGKDAAHAAQPPSS